MTSEIWQLITAFFVKATSVKLIVIYLGYFANENLEHG